jgi:chromate transport protein ChrA
VVGILLATAYRLGKSSIKEPLAMAIALVAFLTGPFVDISAALIVLAAGLIGIAPLRASPPQKQSRKGEP